MSPTEGIAIIGMSGVFPGSKNLREFWRNLIEGRDLVSEIPAERWNWRETHGDPARDKTKTHVKHGGFIDGAGEFDAGFFKISPAEAEAMDPQQRLVLEHTLIAMEDAGYAPDILAGTNVGVFIGCMYNDYRELVGKASNQTAQMFIGNANTMLANRVSFHFDFRGPSEPIDTACSSSLIAVHRGVKSLLMRECDLVFAGGVTLMLSPAPLIGMTQMGLMAKDGRCKTFAKDADGIVRGEGCGIVLLKRLSAALRDSDQIYAVIIGSAVNHGGHVGGVSVPNPHAQADVLRLAYKDADISPATITYIEAHGTGTALGDPIEIAGLKKAFSTEGTGDVDRNVAKQRCFLGSVKTNIGHLEPASGIASLIKVALCLRYKTIPKTLHVGKTTVNSYLELDESPFQIAFDTIAWPQREGLNTRRAGISSFGFGGANCHLVLEENNLGQASNVRIPVIPLFVLSAKSEDVLKNYAQHMLDFVNSQLDENCKDSIDFEEMAYTLQVGRGQYECRLAIATHSFPDLALKLRYFIEGKTDLLAAGIHFGVSKTKTRQAAHFLANELANNWQAGFEIDFSGYYSEKHRELKPTGAVLPQKKSLPTYPFHKKHFWITSGTTFRKAAPEVRAKSEGAFDVLFLAGLIKREFVPADLKGGFEICELSCRIPTFDAGRSPRNYVLEDNYRPQSNVRDVDILLVPELKTYSTPTGKLSIYEEGIVYRVGVGTISINDVSVKTSGTNRWASAIDNPQSAALVNIDGSFIDLLEAIRTSLKEITGSEKTGSVARSLQSFNCNAELPEQVAIHCAKNYDSANDDATFDVNVCGAAGNMLASIRGLSFATAAEAVPERRDIGDKGSTTMIYAKEPWDRENIDLSKNRSSAVATHDDEVSVLIFADDDDVRQIAESWNSVRSPRFTTVRKGTEEYRERDEHNIEIDAKCESSFIRLMAELDNRKSFPTKILFLWGLKESATNGTSRIAASIYPLMLLTRELLRRPLHKFDLLFAYRYSGANVTPEYEAVAGFFRSIKLETPNANVVSLAFDDEAILWQDMLSLIAKESNTSAFEHIEVRYLQGMRYVKRVEEILPPWRKKPAPKAIANSETYLIIGGAGALGSIVAEFLARINPNITLVLSGRSQLDEQVKRRLRAIWELGAEAFYYPSDITQPESVQHLIDQIDEANGELKGIVHAAGVSRDKFIVESTQQDWDAVLSPKVRGVVLLDEATKNKRLDFFAVISSLSSIVGNRGQGAYAYANGFLDSFCRWRRTQERHGRSIVLNLPWWKTASGFAPDKDGQNYQMSFGYYPLKKEEGLSILNSAFSSSLDQWIAFKAVRSKLHRDLRYYWIIKEDRLEDLRQLLYRNKIVLNNDELQKLFAADVRSVVAATLKMEISEVKESVELMNYGFDSISITSLTNELNIKLATSLTQDTFIKYPTLAQFCEYMVKYFRENLLDYYRRQLNEEPHSRQHELLNFTYENPTRIHFGKNQIEKLRDEIPAASRVLLVYGGESIKRYGIHAQVMAQLRHCEVVEYGGIEAN